MKNFDPDKYFKKYRRHKLVLLSLLPVFIVICFIGLDSPKPVLMVLGLLSLLFLFIITGVVFALLTRKHYNWMIVFLLIVVLAIFLKHYRLPFSGVLLTFGFGGLGSVSIFSSYIFLKRYSNIPFLKYIGVASSIVMFIVSMGLLWKNMHWPLAGIILNIGLVTFIPFLFAFVFTLPNANFVSWSKFERMVFFKSIIIPVIFLYTLSALMFVFPDLWTFLWRSDLLPFGMDSVEIISKTGH
jgi:hypothetical protein